MRKIICAENEPGQPQESTPQLDDGPHFPSSQCGKKFTMSDDHHSHMNSVHLKIKSLKCEMCKRLFAYKRSLGPGRHSCMVNAKVHICGHSRKVFNSRGSPQDHAHSHASMLQHIFSLRHVLSLRCVCACVCVCVCVCLCVCEPKVIKRVKFDALPGLHFLSLYGDKTCRKVHSLHVLSPLRN